jgi:hypothetical protein
MNVESQEISNIFIQDLSVENIDKNINNINILLPVKKNDVYISKLDFVFQTSRLTISKIIGNKIKFNLDDICETLLNKFDTRIILFNYA